MRGGGLPWPGSSDLSESTSRKEELLMGNGSRLPKAEPLKSQSPETELLESILASGGCYHGDDNMALTGPTAQSVLAAPRAQELAAF